MRDYFCTYVAVMDTNDTFVYIGWCPEKVRITYLADGQENLWYRLLGNDGAIVRAAAGDRTITTDKGIKLVKFIDTAIGSTADPAEVDPVNFIDANGIQITSDVAFLASDTIVFVEAWRMSNPWFKCAHDGGTSQLFVEDASYDFKDLGVCGNCQWIVYNQSNGDYAYVKEVLKPMGKAKYCRLVLAEDQAGTATTAAAIADADVFYVFSCANAWYPMSDIALMT